MVLSLLFKPKELITVIRLMREAKRLGLTGWVKNRHDQAVECVVEGEEDQVKDFLSWAQHGPSTARVEKTETRWRSYTGEFADFRILA